MRSLDEIIHLAELAKKKDPGTTNAILISALKPEKADKVGKILSLSAMSSIIAQKENPFWETPTPDEIPKGEIGLGQIFEGHKLGFDFSLPLELFTEHIGIFGMTGSGKSFLCKHIARQLIKKLIPVWFFDFEDEFSDLFIEDPDSFYVLDPGSIKINLFQNPPNAKPLEWFEKLMNVLRESLYLRDGSINMLGEILFQQLKIRGVLDGGNNYPALKDVHRELNKLRFRINTRNSGYWESLNNRFSDMDKLPMFCCKTGLDFPWLMNKSVVFKVGGLSDYHQNLFVNYLLTYVSLYREKTEDKRLLVMLLDEGHRIINYEKAKRADLAEPISFECARNFRKRGVSLILSDQVPSLIPASWMGNLGTRIVLRLSHGGCIKAISDALALDQEQRAFIPEMPRRAAILHYIDWKKPFLINIPELSFKRLDRNFVNEFADKKMRELSYVAYEEENVNVRTFENERKEEKATEIKKAPGDSLLKEEMDYLESINREPFLPVTERDKRLGISGWKGNNLRERLIKKDVIEKVLINTGKRGGIITLVKTTANGRAIVESLGMKANGQKGKGSFTHQFWAHVIKTHYEKTGEAKPSIENDSLGKAADVLLEMGDRKIAVEIAIHDNESFNVSKDLVVGFDEVWVCTETEEMMEKIRESLRKNIGSEILEKVRFRLLTEFYERSANIKRNIGAQPVGLRADEEIKEKAKKEEEKVNEREEKKKKKEVNVAKNINKNERAPDGELLTVEEVSLSLGISRSTVKKWVAKRILPVVKLGSGKKGLVRVRKKDLDNWVENQLERKENPLPAKKKALRNRKNQSFEDFVKALKSGSLKKSEDSDG
jgi:excisionase family DNA binding protein